MFLYEIIGEFGICQSLLTLRLYISLISWFCRGDFTVHLLITKKKENHVLILYSHYIIYMHIICKHLVAHNYKIYRHFTDGTFFLCAYTYIYCTLPASKCIQTLYIYIASKLKVQHYISYYLLHLKKK